MYSPTLYRRTSPGTLWRRALRRVDRRAARLNGYAARSGLDFELAYAVSFLSHEHQLLVEAVRLSNQLAGMSR